MNTFKMSLTIRAECQDDAEELIQDYSGQETDIEIKSIKKVRE